MRDRHLFVRTFMRAWYGVWYQSVDHQVVSNRTMRLAHTHQGELNTFTAQPISPSSPTWSPLGWCCRSAWTLSLPVSRTLYDASVLVLTRVSLRHPWDSSRTIPDWFPQDRYRHKPPHPWRYPDRLVCRYILVRRSHHIRSVAQHQFLWHVRHSYWTDIHQRGSRA